MPFLSMPQVQYRESFIAAIQEFQAEGRYQQWDISTLLADFPGFVQQLSRRASHPVPGRVPESLFWLIGDDHQTYIGRVSIRHNLNERLRIIGGHIGYEIRPSLRKQGYGLLICKLGLEQAWKLGLRRVMVTCDEDNIASRKIIEANGGILDSCEVVDKPGILCLRYWIDLEHHS